MWLDQMGRQGMDYWVRVAGMGLGSAIAVAELGERFWGRLVDDQRASIDLASGARPSTTVRSRRSSRPMPPPYSAPRPHGSRS